MKRLSVALLSVIALMMGLLVATSSTAVAAEPESGSEITSSYASSSSSTKAAAHSVNGVSITSSVTVLEYIQAKGATKKQMQAKKIRLPRAMTLLTSYRNTAGQEAWHSKTYPKGKLLVWGNDGWFHDPICFNKVKFRTPKQVPAKRIVKGKVKIVTKFVFKATSKSSVNGKATATAKAWCRTDSNYAEANGSGSSEFVATAFASASGRTWARAKAAASSSSAAKLRLEGHTETNVKIKVETDARGKALANAQAKAVCQETEQPPTTPPTVTPPAFMQFRQINDVYVNATTDHCVTVDFPEGHSGTVFWTATYGSFATVSKPAQDTVQVCSTYKAPSEVPSSGTDTITVTATDSVTGKSVSQTTDPFVIKAMPATP